MLKKISVLILSLTLFPGPLFAAANTPVSLTILHLNDTHGRTRAEPYLSRMAQDLKAASENVLILDAGDRLDGQITTNFSKGASMVPIMNAVGYDAMVPGNLDFNFGLKRLKELQQQMDFPILCANVTDRDGKRLFEPYRIFKMAGITVGVFGITTPERLTPITAELTFADPAETARKVVDTLTAAGCDIIIAIAHLGNHNASLSANRSDALAAIPGIDVIIDGHSHTLLPDGRFVGDTLIAQTGEYGENIGVVKVTIQDGKMSKTAELVPVQPEGEAPTLAFDEAITRAIAAEDAKW